MKEFTQEERLQHREKALLAKAEQKAYAEANLRLTFSDENHWRSISSELGFRLPTRYAPSTDAKYIRRFMRHFKLENDWLMKHAGVKNANVLAQLNPTWPSWALVGTLIENYYEEAVNEAK